MSLRIEKVSLSVVGLVLAALGCDGGGSDITVPDQGPAAKIVIVSGDAQTAVAGTRLRDSLIVRVTDSEGRAVAGQRVGFTASAGTVAPGAAVTKADGRTGAVWVLGLAAGPQTVTATATGNGAPAGLAVTFHATASAPARLDKVAGDLQAALAGSPVATPPAVKVTDAGGHPVPGVAVAFTVTAGGGSVNPATAVTTDPTGVAAVASWTLGMPGPNALTATVPGTGITGNPATFTATATAAPTVAVGLGPFVGESGCSTDYLTAYYSSAAYDVNKDGVVVGETSCVAAENLTFRWSQATGMQQLANYPGGYPIFGGTINNAGNIAALFGGVTGDFHPVIWTPTNTRIDLAATTCGPYSCGGSPPTGINDKDAVVGPPTASLTGPWRWTPETGLVFLTALGDRTPVAINLDGDIAAVSPGPYPAVGGTAILSPTGALTLINGLLAQDINDQRQVVGANGSWPTTTAALWSEGKGVRTLGTLGGATSYAYGINNSGEVVGSSTTGSGEVHAFYWNPSRGMVDLGPGIAYAISDAGDMVGVAPSGFFPPDMAPDELWQATLWRGTGGVANLGVTARVAAVTAGHTTVCFGDAANWQSKAKMFRCLATHP